MILSVNLSRHYIEMNSIEVHAMMKVTKGMLGRVLLFFFFFVHIQLNFPYDGW